MKDYKPLIFFDVLSLAMGTTLSAGIFILPGMAYAEAGPAVYLSYLFAGMIAFISVCNVAELCSAIPESGGKVSGEYYFVTHSLGPLLGTMAGIVNWLVISLKSAFAIFGIAVILHVFTGFPFISIAIVTCLLLLLLNVLAIPKMIRAEIWVIGGLAIFVAFYVIMGRLYIVREHFPMFITQNPRAIFATAGFVFISFSGLLNVTSIAEKVKYPRKQLAFGVITAVLLMTIIYVVLVYVTVGVLKPEQIRSSLTPLADAAAIMAGKPGVVFCSVFTLFALLTSAAFSIMTASQYPTALSRDNLLPRMFSFTIGRLRTPIISLLLTGILIIASFTFRIDTFVKVASTIALTSHLLSCLVIIILHESQIAEYQPGFYAPLYPWLPISGFALGMLLISQMGDSFVELSIGVVIVGLFIYAVYGRKKAEQEYVLLHLITRIVDKELSSSSLDSELRQILYQLDETASDPFVQLLKTSPVVDILGAVEIDDVFRMIAEHLAQKTGISQEHILTQLQQREQDCSTAITPFVAIPHVVVEGEQIFHLFVARCQHGIHFSETHQHVKAMFVLLGTKDERDRHLKTLAAIAKIVQEEDFQKKWEMAGNEEQLRDMLLLLRERH
ncbi:amino acid permease-associated region [Candidatus Vecturithrix granuli]|uniref:Amino acid permease-associated region n=1 Tax=Vecturithrix granuli TaxID=1499967 RepID=A0A081BYU7_VECG1|nr:amino acid permease-associated region [Candidatus Vecturithrix granuli]